MSFNDGRIRVGYYDDDEYQDNVEVRRFREGDDFNKLTHHRHKPLPHRTYLREHPPVRIAVRMVHAKHVFDMFHPFVVAYQNTHLVEPEQK